MAIVIDSDIEDIKYVLELTPEGFIKTEYVQRALLLRHENKIFGIKRLITPLTPEQSLRLRQIADQLTTKLSVASKNYGKIFDTSIFDETAADFKKPKQQIKRVKFEKEKKTNELVFGKDFGGDSDEESMQNNDDDDGNYVEMVRIALRDTRTILGEVPVGSALYEQIYEIFNLFSGRLGAEDDANDEQDLSNIDANSALAGRKPKKERTLDLLALPKLVNYFRVANSDD